VLSLSLFIFISNIEIMNENWKIYKSPVPDILKYIYGLFLGKVRLLLLSLLKKINKLNSLLIGCRHGLYILKVVRVVWIFSHALPNKSILTIIDILNSITILMSIGIIKTWRHIYLVSIGIVSLNITAITCTITWVLICCYFDSLVFDLLKI